MHRKKFFCNKLNFCSDCFQKNIRKQSDIDIDNNIHNLKKLNV
jgi:hypothetical protein